MICRKKIKFKASPSAAALIMIDRKSRRLSLYLLTLLAFIVFVSILFGWDIVCIFNMQPKQLSSKTGGAEAINNDHDHRLPFAVREEGVNIKGCDVFSGRWVRDESTRPLYRETECPYIQPQLTCQKHGRPDKLYQFWRWEPHGCSLPRYKLSSTSTYMEWKILNNY